MALTPMDIYNKEFGKSFRGYDEEEVDMFLDQVVDEYEKLQKANVVASEKVASLTERLEHYQSLEETLKETLMTAQNTAEEVIANARKKAAMIIDEAQRQAREIAVRASSEIEHIQGMDMEVRKAAAVFKSRFVALLEAQLDFFRQETAEVNAKRDEAQEESAPPQPQPSAQQEPLSFDFTAQEPVPADAPLPPQEVPPADETPLQPMPDTAGNQAPIAEPLGTAGDEIADDADALIQEIQHYSSLRDDKETVSEEGFVIGSDD